LILFLILYAANSHRQSYAIVLKVMLIFSVAVSIWHFLLIFILKNIRQSDSHFRKALVIGSNETAKEFNHVLETHRGYGYKTFGVFNESNSAATILNAKELISNRKVEDVFCAVSLSDSDLITELMIMCEKNFINFKIIPDLSSTLQRKLSIELMGLMPVISLGSNPLNIFSNKIIKRSFDSTISVLVAVFILSWLIPIVALMIKLNSKGPIFYLQNRSGINNKTFRIIKFRTMFVTESDQEFMQAQQTDARITNAGKWLRKFNIDELPQIINVLIGEMSLVGPRPHPILLDKTYQTSIERYISRHNVIPGLTGLAQVRGFRGNTNDDKLMEERIQADLFYIENWSFWLDIKIILLTFRNMIKGDKHAF
ncbi:MAG: sugar transferase, partial [Ignavibacteria bacterium]|nr:sugar transferase [Ignavibacteria bacterium]